MSKVALILGSLRRPGQGIGIANWLTPVLRQALNNPNSRHPSSSQMDVVFVDPTKPPLPLGAITDGTHVPADIRDPAKHPNPAVREWATFVSSCSGFVVLSPEYNGSYPGELKNALDHLYWEWRNKPVVVVTYGSSGGKRCATLLRSLLGGAFKMQLAQKEVAIKWPKGSANVPTEGEPPEWLKAFEPDVLEAIEEMKRLMAKPQP
ncbi:flavo protein [Lentinus tigrinus ALCF2SS1-7]|uniref:flavo protein n=1 Tax=Lentinus tigrinus ALCF2SS1-7 TaxID=1328758 RepID=UPI0011661424|nr:flavo protein [Lentinus tigrinus ALCF2SS1-7]